MDDIETSVAEAHEAIGIDPATGFATDGEWPINARLRAEAMARAGVETDPAGIVTDDMIAATAERLDREDAEEEKTTPSMDWTKDKLREEADRLHVPVESDANKAAILAAIEAAPSAPNMEG